MGEEWGDGEWEERMGLIIGEWSKVMNGRRDGEWGDWRSEVSEWDAIRTRTSMCTKPHYSHVHGILRAQDPTSTKSQNSFVHEIPLPRNCRCTKSNVYEILRAQDSTSTKS